MVREVPGSNPGGTPSCDPSFSEEINEKGGPGVKG